MELHQLRYMVAVADTGSFTAAAAREFVSQSGVSAQIAKLERELGHALFDRAGRSVVLTPAGEVLLPHAREAIAAVTAVRDVSDDLSGLVRGHVRLGMVAGCAIPPFFEGLADFVERYPDITVDLHEDDSDVLIQHVRRGALDVALAAFSGVTPEGCSAQVVVDDALVAVMAASHPLARRRVTLTLLGDHRPMCLGRGTGVRASWDTACRAAGLDIPLSFVASSPVTLTEMARRGLGVGILCESMVDPAVDVVARPIVDASVRTTLALVTADTEPSAAARELRHVLGTALG